MKKKILISLFVVLLLCLGVIVGYDVFISRSANASLYEEVDNIPHRKVGIILVTLPISTWNGRRNYYSDHLIKPEAVLFKAEKVDWDVISGGDYRNTEKGYVIHEIY